MTLQATNGHLLCLVSCLVSFPLWSGCRLRPLQQPSFDEQGYIAYRQSSFHRTGIVVGVPHGATETAAIDYGTKVSEQTGAALVVAYGFRSKRNAGTQPLVRSVSLSSGGNGPRQRGSVAPEFRDLLKKTAGGPIKVYLGIRVGNDNSDQDQIEAVSSGLTFEQLSALTELFERIRDPAIAATKAPVVDLALDPIDKITPRVADVKYNGALMVAAKGLDVTLPPRLAADSAKLVYGKILSEWLGESLNLIETNPAHLPQAEVVLLNFGKIESVSARQGMGIVVGAPHGSFDFYTAGAARKICYRTGLACVIATGFTPTETGDGWRINVNRPSERHASLTLPENETARAMIVYKHFKDSVMRAARGDLKLYIDIHQNSGSRIEVASVGITKKEASVVKETYLTLRQRALAKHPDARPVELAIEPLDAIEVGAWAAKTNGILSVAKRSLHFELPSDSIMAPARQREIYTSILAELIGIMAERYFLAGE